MEMMLEVMMGVLVMDFDKVAQPGGLISSQCKWCHLVAKFETNASGAIWWPNLELMQVAPSGGQFCN